jgi:hypothetical protein
VLGVGIGTAETVIMDPSRLIGEASLREWQRLAPDRHVITMDLFELSDDYRVRIRHRAGVRELRWVARALQRPRGRALRQERGLELATASPSVLFSIVEALGFREPPVDRAYALYGRAGARAAARSAQRVELARWSPPVMRLLVVRGVGPTELVCALARFAELVEEVSPTYQNPKGTLSFQHMLGGSMAGAHIGVGGGRDWTALFDASGNMVLDLRWLHASIVPQRAAAVFGPVASFLRFQPRERPAFGFALYERGELVRRVTCVRGSPVREALGFPARYVEPVGRALPIEASHPFPQGGAEWAYVAGLLDALGMHGRELERVDYRYFAVTPR